MIQHLWLEPQQFVEQGHQFVVETFSSQVRTDGQLFAASELYCKIGKLKRCLDLLTAAKSSLEHLNTAFGFLLRQCQQQVRGKQHLEDAEGKHDIRYIAEDAFDKLESPNVYQ